MTRRFECIWSGHLALSRAATILGKTTAERRRAFTIRKDTAHIYLDEEKRYKANEIEEKKPKVKEQHLSGEALDENKGHLDMEKTVKYHQKTKAKDLVSQKTSFK